MAHVTNFLGLLEQLQSADITVHQGRCAIVRNRNATCMKCADVCTSGCISYDDNELVIEPERCIGCGTCATVCPTCALEAHRPNDAELLQACRAAADVADGQVVIACDQLLAAADGLYDPEKVVGVTCLGRVEESLLVTLAALGVRRVSLVQARCAQCEHVSGFEMARVVCDTASALLATWNNDMRIDLAEKLPSSVRRAGDEGYDASRRSFFSSMKDEAKNVAAVTADYAVKDALGVEERREPRFVKVGKDGTIGVTHRPVDCVKCRCCTDICPEGALELSDEVFAVDLLSGAQERYPMKPLKNPPGNPHQIWHSMKDLLNCDQVYER